MEQLAEKYAKLKKTKVIVSHINLDGTITFVLESGPKLTMTTRQLEEAIAEMVHTKGIEEAIDEIKSGGSAINTTDGVDKKEAKTAARAGVKRKVAKRAEEKTKPVITSTGVPE